MKVISNTCILQRDDAVSLIIDAAATAVCEGGGLGGFIVFGMDALYVHYIRYTPSPLAVARVHHRGPETSLGYSLGERGGGERGKGPSFREGARKKKHPQTQFSFLSI